MIIPWPLLLVCSSRKVAAHSSETEAARVTHCATRAGKQALMNATTYEKNRKSSRDFPKKARTK